MDKENRFKHVLEIRKKEDFDALKTAFMRTAAAYRRLSDDRSDIAVQTLRDAMHSLAITISVWGEGDAVNVTEKEVHIKASPDLLIFRGRDMLDMVSPILGLEDWRFMQSAVMP